MDAPVFVFLNKVDLFALKIQEKDLSIAFPFYKGSFFFISFLISSKTIHLKEGKTKILLLNFSKKNSQMCMVQMTGFMCL